MIDLIFCYKYKENVNRRFTSEEFVYYYYSQKYYTQECIENDQLVEQIENQKIA